jgi:hypothetical protein
MGISAKRYSLFAGDDPDRLRPVAVSEDTESDDGATAPLLELEGGEGELELDAALVPSPAINSAALRSNHTLIT